MARRCWRGECTTWEGLVNTPSVIPAHAGMTIIDLYTTKRRIRSTPSRNRGMSVV